MIVDNATKRHQSVVGLSDRFPVMESLYEEFFWSVFAHSPIGVFVVEGGVFKLTNLYFEKSTGYKHGELLGKNPTFLVIHGDKEQVNRDARTMLKGKRTVPYRFRIRTMTGDLRWIEAGLAPFHYAGRRAAIGYYMDVTDQVLLKRELRELKGPAKQAKQSIRWQDLLKEQDDDDPEDQSCLICSL